MFTARYGLTIGTLLAFSAEARVRSQSTSNLWWAVWHWDRFSPVLLFPPISITPPMVHSHLHSRVDLTKKERRAKPRNLPKSKAHWEIWTVWQKSL